MTFQGETTNRNRDCCIVPENFRKVRIPFPCCLQLRTCKLLYSSLFASDDLFLNLFNRVLY